MAACEICYQSQPSLLGVCPHAFVYAFASIFLRGCRIGARHPAWLPARFAINPNSVCLGSVPAFLSMQLLASAFEAAGSVPGTRRGCLRDLLSIPTLPDRCQAPGVAACEICYQSQLRLLGVCPRVFVDARVCPQAFVYAFASIFLRGCWIGARHPAWLPARFAINPNSVCSEFARGLSPCICPGFLSCPNERRFAIPTAT